MVLVSDAKTTALPNFVLVHLQLTEIWCKIKVGVFLLKHSVDTNYKLFETRKMRKPLIFTNIKNI